MSTTTWERLSAGSSRTEHTHRAEGEKGCRGCRWFETRLHRRWSEDHDDWEYKLEMIGRSSVEGEVDRIRTETTTSAHAVVDFLTLGEPDKRYLPKISRMILHEASDQDGAIATALDDFDEMRGHA